MPYEPCGMCHDTGMALYVRDVRHPVLDPTSGEVTDYDESFTGPFLNPMRCADEIQRLCEAYGLDLRGGGFRFYVTALACPCKRQPRRTTGQENQIDKLRRLFREPKGAQFVGMGWMTYEALQEPEKAKGLRAAQFYASESASKRGKTGLVLAGPCGVGKTGLMYLIYQARKCEGAVWCDFNEMMALIQASYAQKGNDTQQIIQALEFVPILLIDDMGDVARLQAMTDDKRDKTYDVLRVRHERKLLTIITTNLDPPKMRLQFGSRIYSRIRELCNWVNVGGRDLREPLKHEAVDDAR